MPSLEDRVAHQRDTIIGRSTDIRRREDRIQKKLGSISVDLGNLEWKNGIVSVQVNQRMGILLLIAGIGALFLLKFRGQS